MEKNDQFVSDDRFVWRRTGNHLLLIGVLVIIICGYYTLFPKQRLVDRSDHEGEKSVLAKVASVADTTEVPEEKENVVSYELSTDEYTEVNELYKVYFQALKEIDTDTLNRIMVNPPDAKELEAERQYIQAYDNIECYTREGILDKTYITYVYYEVRFKNIDTPVPSLIRQYICTNEDGDLYINNSTVDGEVAFYLTEVQNSEPVQKLIAQVNEGMEDAKSKDKELNAFISILQGND